ncbi:MAG: aldose 1-epimerase, partial [Geminicoccaceae bacterium]
ASLTNLDHDFTGGEVAAVLHWPSSGMRLLIDADPIFRHVVVFVPPERNYLCVEPVTHVANAVNLANAGYDNTGLRVLQPGETLCGSMRFSASTI